jgi:4-alpha-glucanotransferase
MGKIIGTSVPLGALRSVAEPEAACGTFKTGLAFLEWLRRTGQHAWQLLPLSETRLESGSAWIHMPSPYQGYGVGLDPRYLDAEAAARVPKKDEIRRFEQEHADWLPDYALFSALRDRFGTDDWTTWPSDVRRRRSAALRAWADELADGVAQHARQQWAAHAALAGLRERAKSLGITLIGDLPFYLPLRSPLVWAHQRCFDLGRDGKPRSLSGVPEGPKSHFGRQVWGHPLYRWGWWSRRELIGLWKRRLGYHARIYDLMRLDHAKGLYHFGAMDPVDPTRDRMRKGPGSPVLEELIRFARSAGLQVYAEDSGDWRDGLHATLRKLEVAGIRILRFAYNEKQRRIDRDYATVANYSINAVAATTTHDTETLMGYLAILSADEKRHLAIHVGVSHDADDAMLAVRLRGAILGSPARTVIIPIQDWLLTKDRINVPGTEKPVGDPNWRYRLTVPIEDLPIGTA